MKPVPAELSTSVPASAPAVRQRRPKQPRQQQPAVPAQDTGKSKKRKRIAGSRQEPGTAIWYNSALLISPAGYQTPLPICAWALPDVNLRDKRLLVSRLQAGTNMQVASLDSEIMVSHAEREHLFAGDQ